jgi:hypothetical protein
VEKVILLKTQLAEAAKLGKSEDFRFQRLAVILLDNFIEIQLTGLIQEKFSWDGIFIYQEKKYKQKQRQKILKNYDELLKTSLNENFINRNERFLLAFCHDVRNNLYHRIREEELLVNVALRILHEVIYNRQPGWKNTKPFTSYTSKTIDPFLTSQNKKFLLGGNSDVDWKDFLNKYFNFIDKRKPNASKLLSYNMLYKISNIRSNFKFLKKEFPIFHPFATNWDFNKYLLYYSFEILNHEELEEIKEITSKSLRDLEFEKAYINYSKSWRYKSYHRLKEIELKAKELSSLEIHESLEKYISLRSELNMIFESIKKAASDLDQAIQLAIDIARGK